MRSGRPQRRSCTLRITKTRRCAGRVAEGRRREFAAFGFDGVVPNPEDQETYEMSKLKWDEQGEGKNAEMLAWVKALIQLRRSRVCFNDGDTHRVLVPADDEERTLLMERDEARVASISVKRSTRSPCWRAKSLCSYHGQGLTYETIA